MTGRTYKYDRLFSATILDMQLFGLVSIIIAVFLGILWLINTPGGSGLSGQDKTGVDYQEAIDAALTIPGAPAKYQGND